MAPVPIYSHSPINAAKASGVTPQTAAPAEKTDSQPPSAATQHAARQAYPQAKPGAAPSPPFPTGAVQGQRYVPIEPTPTQRLDDQSPPAPQPGAVPLPPGARETVPPPPKVGEKYHPPERTPAPQPANYPSQMSVPAPAVPYSQRGTSATGQLGGTYPVQPLRPISTGDPSPAHLEHPPGYQQDANASDFGSNQRAAHDALLSSDQRRGGAAPDDEDGMWDAAKRLVQVAGEKLSAAESEVWRRINKE